MYTECNFKTKKELKAAVAAGEEVNVVPDMLGGRKLLTGVVWLEGPHYPQPHKWYAEAIVDNGRITKVK
jgi:hypothetical protein